MEGGGQEGSRAGRGSEGEQKVLGFIFFLMNRISTESHMTRDIQGQCSHKRRLTAIPTVTMRIYSAT